MSKHQSDKETIKEIAQEGARALIGLQRQKMNTNYYRSVEDLLKSYKDYQRMLEEYNFEPIQKSHDISVAPPKGSGVKDKLDLREEHINARRASYERTKARYDEIDMVVKQLQQREEFIVIRMYYFGEDAFGNDKFSDKQITFEEIADELEEIGMVKSVRTLRSWRTKLVREMVVLLFGVDGALAIESRDHGKQE